MSGLRLGIDVGGTFTHGVLLQSPGTVLRTSVTPTTHSHERGVAEGIRLVLLELVEGIEAAEVELVAHSTTQATNALLEGDVSAINRIVCVPPGEELLLRMALRDRSIPIGAGQGIPLSQVLVDTEQLDSGFDSSSLDRSRPSAVIQPLAGGQPACETRIRDELELDVRTSVLAGEITQVLGINARARTAGINAAMLPRMLETADFTAEVVNELLPGVPLQVVRSDGGAMDIEEMRSQPILSILSGPAAGASAALHRSGLSELVFIEVGGTSTDITLVRGGRVRHRNATVGGNRLLVPALDLRTVGLGGGSMLDARGRRFGPRSAHIAGLPYLFQAIQRGSEISGSMLWKDGHGDEYLIFSDRSGEGIALTLTDYFLAKSHLENTAEEAVQQLGIEFSPERLDRLLETVEPVLKDADRASRTSTRDLCRPIRELLHSHDSSLEGLTLVGGGGGAPVLYRQLADELELPASLIDDHTVISAVGAALAVTCVSLSRTVAEPRGIDIEELTRQVEERLARQGAERVSTEYDYDSQRQVLTVTGRGNRPYEVDARSLSESELDGKARGILGSAKLLWKSDELRIYTGDQHRSGSRQALALLASGRSLWLGRFRESMAFDPGGLEAALDSIVERYMQYTDGGALLPSISLMSDGRYIPLDQLGSAELVREVLRWEKLPENSPGIFLIN